MSQASHYLKTIYKPFNWLWQYFTRYWQSNWWHKAVTILVVALACCFGGMYGIAAWYQHSEKNKPLNMGVTFIADYANYLGVDAHQTYEALLNDLQVKHLRLVSYWANVEPTAGRYDFTELDYEISQAETHGAKVTLAVGLRQPRWPECHTPTWVDTSKTESTWVITTVASASTNRYPMKSASLSIDACGIALLHTTISNTHIPVGTTPFWRAVKSCSPVKIR
jgi:hypothetical protein